MDKGDRQVAPTGYPSRIFTINAHGNGLSPAPGMKIGQISLPTAHCPLFLP